MDTDHTIKASGVLEGGSSSDGVESKNSLSSKNNSGQDVNRNKSDEDQFRITTSKIGNLEASGDFERRSKTSNEVLSGVDDPDQGLECEENGKFYNLTWVS